MNDELGISTATRLHLIENTDELEGTRREDSFYLSIHQFYIECVRKMIAKFPFADLTINDLSVLDPRHRFEASAASVTRLFKRFTPTADLRHYTDGVPRVSVVTRSPSTSIQIIR